MSPPFSEDINFPRTDHADVELPQTQDEVVRWLEQLQRSDRSFYNTMAIEVWAIAQTMDTLIPGFWSRFMENRQLALQTFLAQRQAQQVNFSDSAPRTSLLESEPDGMMESEKQEN